MLQIGRILVPVDFSERCAAAARRGVVFSVRFGSRLIFAHVIDRFPYEGTEKEIFYGENGEIVSGRDLDTKFRRKLHEFTARVASSSPEEVLLKGDPASQIVQFAQEQGVDLILIPTHGHGPFRKFLLGSVTAKVLHDANCPVLTGTHREEKPPETPPPYLRIGCALDLSEQSEALLRWADEFARVWSAKLLVIHAMPFVPAIVDDVHFLDTADLRRSVMRGAEDKIKNILRKVGCEADICIDNGHPVHVVTSTAAEQKLDALVIGRGMATQRASRLPTHAYGIIRASPCPVFSLP